MEEMMNALVAECDRQSRERDRLLLEQNGFSVQTVLNGAQALDMLKAGRFDFLCLSLALPLLDGLAVLERLPECRLYRYPFVLVHTAMGEALCQRALALGADAALVKPVEKARFEAVLQQARQCTSHIGALAALRASDAARACVAALGVPAHLKGFEYLACAVALCYADDRMAGKATTLLYPRVAEQCGATPGGVEHAIRQAIEVTWTRGEMDTLLRTFGNSIDPQRGKPTNIECIALLAQRLRKECEREA